MRSLVHKLIYRWIVSAPTLMLLCRLTINELKPMIPSRCLEIATNEGDVVPDPFGGGGPDSSFRITVRR
jgi:hypothetical protein